MLYDIKIIQGGHVTTWLVNTAQSMVQEKLNISSYQCDIDLNIGRGKLQKMLNDLNEIWGGHVIILLVSKLLKVWRKRS